MKEQISDMVILNQLLQQGTGQGTPTNLKHIYIYASLKKIMFPFSWKLCRVLIHMCNPSQMGSQQYSHLRDSTFWAAKHD